MDKLKSVEPDFSQTHDAAYWDELDEPYQTIVPPSTLELLMLAYDCNAGLLEAENLDVEGYEV